VNKALLGIATAALIVATIRWTLVKPGIPRSILEAKYISPSSQFLLLPGKIRAHVSDRGPRQAQTLVLLHGSFDSFITWEPWVSRLTNTLRVITVDLPGHGLTGAVNNGDYGEEGMVRFVAKVADALGLHTFALGGNSMGGRIAARFAEEDPARLTHLILVDSGGLGKRGGRLVEFTNAVLSKPFVARPLLGVAPRWIWAKEAEEAVSKKSVLTVARTDAIWDFNHMEGTPEATIRRFSSAQSAVKEHLSQIQTPTLILWGEEDRLIPVEAAHEFHEGIRNSRLVIYHGTGHLPQEEAPDESAAQVRAFLARH
jgi:pimeloyl-ACP methyl ester carboxylesterase